MVRSVIIDRIGTASLSVKGGLSSGANESRPQRARFDAHSGAIPVTGARKAVGVWRKLSLIPRLEARRTRTVAAAAADSSCSTRGRQLGGARD